MPQFAPFAAITAAITTALTGISRFRDYAQRAEAHGSAARNFANLERELSTLLHASTAEQQRERLGRVTVEFLAALNSMPLLPDLTKFKNEHGDPLFRLITNARLLEEAEITRLVMKSLAGLDAHTGGTFDRLPVQLGRKVTTQPPSSWLPRLRLRMWSTHCVAPMDDA